MIENVTEYNGRILKEFTVFATKKARLLTGICSLIILACSIFEFVCSAYVLGGIFLGLALVFFIANFFTVKFALKKVSAMPKVKVEYKFYPDKLSLTTYSNGEQVENSEIAYNLLYKVVDNKQTLYIYINNVQALLVDCEKFKEPTDKEVVKKYMSAFVPNRK